MRNKDVEETRRDKDVEEQSTRGQRRSRDKDAEEQRTRGLDKTSRDKDLYSRMRVDKVEEEETMR